MKINCNTVAKIEVKLNAADVQLLTAGNKLQLSTEIKDFIHEYSGQEIPVEITVTFEDINIKDYQ